MNQKLLGLAARWSGFCKRVIFSRMRSLIMIMIMVMSVIGFIMSRNGCCTVGVRFEHHVGMCIKKNEQVGRQSHHAAPSQPNCFVFFRSQNKSVVEPRTNHRSAHIGCKPDFRYKAPVAAR